MTLDLARRFSVAAIVLAAIAVAAFIVEDYHTRIALRDAEITNLAGRQRMLSGRIAFLIGYSGDGDAQRELAGTAGKMRREFEALTAANGGYFDAPAVRSLYGEGEHALGPRTQAFLTAAEIGRRNEVQAAYAGLVADIDRAVAAYAAFASERIALLRVVEAAALVAQLTGLLLIGLLVVRPMARHVGAGIAALEVARGRMQAILDAAGEGICGIDREGRITFINPAALALLGLGEEEALGADLHGLVHHHSADGHPLPAEGCPVVEAARGGRQARTELDAFWRRDGSSFPAAVVVSPLREGGQTIGAVVVFTDITARKEAEAAIGRYTEELERSNRELDDFAYVASHDLKEPLRGIHGYASYLLEDYGDRLDGEGRRYLETMRQLVERLERIIDTLLHYSRIGRSQPHLEDCQLADCVNDARSLLAGLLHESGGELAVVTPLPRQRCDRVLVTEVFQNLISNGLKYNDSEKKRVEIGVRPDGVLFVRDNGIGIPEKHRDSVFRIFKRLHGRNQYGGGSGAGLTIVKKIVERHGGRLWLEAAPGAGSTFLFTLTPQGDSHGDAAADPSRRG